MRRIVLCSSFLLLAACAKESASPKTAIAPAVPSKTPGEVVTESLMAKGVADADKDITQGKYALHINGYPPAWFFEYEALLKDRLNIEYVAGSGCTDDNEMTAYFESYDNRVKQVLKARHGPDIFEKFAREAQSRHEASTGPTGDRKPVH